MTKSSLNNAESHADADESQRADAIELAVGHFEDAWELGARPDVAQFLCAAPELRGELLRELVHVDLERRLTRGLGASAADYLDRFPELSSDTSFVAELTQAEAACRRGSPPIPNASATENSPPEKAADTDHAGVNTVAPSPAPLAPAPFAPDDLPAIAGYEVLREIGRGGMGVVYLARQLALGRLVALKVVDSGRLRGAELAERLRKEAAALARLQHPNIVGVYDVGEHRGRAFLTIEYMPGGSLQHRLDGGPLAPVEAARVRAHAGGRARGGPRRGHRPPRSQAEQRAVRRRRHAEDRRLWPGSLRRRQLGHDRNRRDRRHAQLYGSRAGLRRKPPSRPGSRRLRPRRRPLRRAHRPPRSSALRPTTRWNKPATNSRNPRVNSSRPCRATSKPSASSA